MTRGMPKNAMRVRLMTRRLNPAWLVFDLALAAIIVTVWVRLF